jgi:hypothetical protein
MQTAKFFKSLENQTPHNIASSLINRNIIFHFWDESIIFL